MPNPTPQQRPTLDYAGPPPNLSRPIDHPGMHLLPLRESVFGAAAQVLAGFVLAVWLVLVLGWLAAQLFPDTSAGILKQAIVPCVGMIALAGYAVILYRNRPTRGLAFGLWTGGGLAL